MVEATVTPVLAEKKTSSDPEAAPPSSLLIADAPHTTCNLLVDTNDLLPHFHPDKTNTSLQEEGKQRRENTSLLSSDEKRRAAAIMRRMDRSILPVASLLYFFSFVDRTAIGNSRVAGMNKDLGLTDGQYRLALSCFFITYAFFEVPSNLCLRRWGARQWLPMTALPWGLMMLLTGLVQDSRGLITCRVLLGVFEAGIVPGLTTLLGYIYPQSALQLRIAIFFVSANFGGAFGGLLAYALSRIETVGVEGWRWIFIIEGILTMLSAPPAYYLLCNGLEDVKGISADDKAFMKERVLNDACHGIFETEIKRQYVWDAFKDYKVYIVAAIFGLTAINSLSFALTLPVLLNTSFGYDHIKSQLMTVPVYLVAVPGVILFAYLSDHQQRRLLYYLVGMLISMIGWLISFKSSSPRVRYFASFPAIWGVFAAVPCSLALASQNLAQKTKRSTGLAIQLTFSSIIPVVSSSLFPVKEAPRYLTGHKVCISCCISSMALAVAYGYVLKWENEKKRKMRESGEAAKLTNQELIDLGDKSPYFVYQF